MDEWLHAAGVKAFGFLEVTYVKTISLASGCSSDFKVVPLEVAFGVCVDQNEEIILVGGEFDGTVEIASLKMRVKLNLVGNLWVVTQKESIGVFYFFRRLDVRIRKWVILISAVVDEESVFISWTQIDHFVWRIVIFFQ